MCCYVSAAEDGEVSTASHHNTELGTSAAQGTAWIILTVHWILSGLGQVVGSAGERVHVFIPKQRGSTSHTQTWRPRPALRRPTGLGAARHPLSSIKINCAARPVSKTHRCETKQECKTSVRFLSLCKQSVTSALLITVVEGWWWWWWLCPVAQLLDICQSCRSVCRAMTSTTELQWERPSPCWWSSGEILMR